MVVFLVVVVVVVVGDDDDDDDDTIPVLCFVFSVHVEDLMTYGYGTFLLFASFFLLFLASPCFCYGWLQLIFFFACC